MHDRGDMWLLYLVTVLYGLGGDVFAAARSAMLKAMLPDELLGEANGALPVDPRRPAPRRAARRRRHLRRVRRRTPSRSSMRRASSLSAATLVALPFAEPPTAPKEHHFLREISAGITHIARTRVLRQLTIGVAAALLVVGFSET